MSDESLDRYTIGVDFGTLSGRAVVVRVADGAELGSAVHDYPHAVSGPTAPASGRTGRCRSRPTTWRS
jgi:L-ribulokinase